MEVHQYPYSEICSLAAPLVYIPTNIHKKTHKNKDYDLNFPTYEF